MPGRNFKSIGIWKELYEKIKREKKEGESVSEFIERMVDSHIERVMDVAKEKKEIGKSMVKREEKEGEVGITKQDLVNVENEIVDRIKDMIDALKYH